MRNTRWGTPEELANLIVFALSDRASFVNGAVLVADNAQGQVVTATHARHDAESIDDGFRYDNGGGASRQPGGFDGTLTSRSPASRSSNSDTAWPRPMPGSFWPISARA